MTVNDEKYKIMSKYFQGGNYNEIDKMEKLIGKLIGKMWKCVSFGSFDFLPADSCNRGEMLVADLIFQRGSK